MQGKLRTSQEGADTVVWLALQPIKKLVSGAFYFDRAEAPKYLPFTATKGSHVSVLDSIVQDLRSMSGLSSWTMPFFKSNHTYIYIYIYVILQVKTIYW